MSDLKVQTYRGRVFQLSAANSTSSNPAMRRAGMLKGGLSLGASYGAISSAQVLARAAPPKGENTL